MKVRHVDSINIFSVKAYRHEHTLRITEAGILESLRFISKSNKSLLSQSITSKSNKVLLNDQPAHQNMAMARDTSQKVSTMTYISGSIILLWVFCCVTLKNAVPARSFSPLRCCLLSVPKSTSSGRGRSSVDPEPRVNGLYLPNSHVDIVVRSSGLTLLLFCSPHLYTYISLYLSSRFYGCMCHITYPCNQPYSVLAD